MCNVKQSLRYFADEMIRSSYRRYVSGFSRDYLKKPVKRPNSLHDHWFKALYDVNPVLQWDQNEILDLISQIDRWERPVAIELASPFRLCFQLEEPPAGIEEPQEEPDIKSKNNKKAKDVTSWKINYLLQNTTDPSLLIPAEKSLEKKAAAIAKDYAKQDFLHLGILTFVVGDEPRNPANLFFPAWKTQIRLVTKRMPMEPFDFLTNHAAILEQMGFGVVLPAWWSGKGTKQHLALKAKVRSPKLSGGSGLGLSEILDFQWEIALGDRVIPLKELQELARLKMPLVNVRGQWIHVDPKDIQAAIEFWEKGLSGKGTVRDVIHMALGHSKPP